MGFNQADNPFLVSTITPILLAAFYVGSLYVWSNRHDRDHPDTIKRRFISAAFVTIFSPTFVLFFGSPNLLAKFSLSHILGLRLEGLFAASVYPVLLTVILFLGPTVVLFTDARFTSFFSLDVWKQNFQDWIWWRNQIVAPFSEEFTFRACMIPILLGYYTPNQAVLISPLFFGVAHLHHMIERIRQGQSVMTSFLVSLFQFTYTTVFGMYSALLFVKTGHFAAPFLVHSYCNFMGFPDVTEVFNFEPKKRLLVSLTFVAGVVLFYFLLHPVLNTDIYSNTIYLEN